jgi:hypothetical protein
VWPKHVAPLIKPLLTPYRRKESCDLTVINKAYIVTLHNGMDTVKKIISQLLHVSVILPSSGSTLHSLLKLYL